MPNTDPYNGSFTIPDRLHVDALSFDGDLLTISGGVRGSQARCPVCGETSRRVHGHYTRTLADLPWSGIPVRLRLRVRKFFCDQPSCERRIFVGQKSVTTDASGKASFTFKSFQKVATGHAIMATDASGNTSEFSVPRKVIAS